MLEDYPDERLLAVSWKDRSESALEGMLLGFSEEDASEMRGSRRNIRRMSPSFDARLPEDVPPGSTGPISTANAARSPLAL